MAGAIQMLDHARLSASDGYTFCQLSRGVDQPFDRDFINPEPFREEDGGGF